MVIPWPASAGTAAAAWGTSPLCIKMAITQLNIAQKLPYPSVSAIATPASSL